jgi:hypothetical protein
LLVIAEGLKGQHGSHGWKVQFIRLNLGCIYFLICA